MSRATVPLPLFAFMAYIGTNLPLLLPCLMHAASHAVSLDAYVALGLGIAQVYLSHFCRYIHDGWWGMLLLCAGNDSFDSRALHGFVLTKLFLCIPRSLQADDRQNVLRLGHDYFFPDSNSSVTRYPKMWRYVLWSADSVVKWNSKEEDKHELVNLDMGFTTVSWRPTGIVGQRIPYSISPGSKWKWTVGLNLQLTLSRWQPG
jgi:hypothetical protein